MEQTQAIEKVSQILNRKQYKKIKAMDRLEMERYLAAIYISGHEEAGELAEAVREGDEEHITEEIADVLVLVEQIIKEHNIVNVSIIEVFEQKVERTIERIAAGYYESEDKR